ncbi:hypothetical protein EDD11_007309 [Mortierella claussenii]|nr:hypothetical protein EDD11_007309 [Mortierella claussenii]
MSKSHLEPTQSTEYLGFTINNKTMTFSVPKYKMQLPPQNEIYTDASDSGWGIVHNQNIRAGIGSPEDMQ